MATPSEIALRQPELDRHLVRGLAWTGGIRWGSQILTWASTLIVARLLRPEDYGIVGMATVYLGLITLLSEFGVGTTVVTLRDLSAKQTAQLNGLALLFGLSGFVVSCLVAAPLGRFFRSPALPAVVIAMSTNFVILSLQSVPSALLQRELRFKLLSAIEGGRALTLATATVLFAWFGFRYWTLVLGSLIGTAIGTSLILARRRCAFAWPRKEELRHTFRFTGDIVASRLAWYCYSNADFVISGRVLGAQALGAYNVAWSLANSPIEKINGVVNGVAPALFSKVQREKAMLRRYLLNLTEGIALITFPISIGLAFVAQDFVVSIIGPKWQGAVAPVRLLACYVAFRSIAPLVPLVLNVVGETRFAMWNSIAAAVLLPSAFYFGSRWGNTGIAAAWLIVYPVVALPLFHRALHRMELPWLAYLRVLLPPLAASAGMVLAVWLARTGFGETNRLARLLGEVSSGAVAYILLLTILKFREKDKLLRMWQLLRAPAAS